MLLQFPTLCSSLPNKIPNHRHPPLLLRFKTSHRESLRYLKTLGINIENAQTIDRTLSVVNYLQSKGFSDTHFPRLSFLCPEIFSSHPTEIDTVFAFLTVDLGASSEGALGLIIRCPEILLSDVDFCLRPTLRFLRKLGLENLSSPTSLNAHLLNSRIDKLVYKIAFLESIGFSYQESSRICARLPAIFGYSVENNLWPKFEYLTVEMERTIGELKEFPQYFGFSLEKRIAPRHLHLMERNVVLPLARMLLWSDQRFYAKWK